MLLSAARYILSGDTGYKLAGIHLEDDENMLQSPYLELGTSFHPLKKRYSA